MRVIAKSTLVRFWAGRPDREDAKEPALAWYRLVVAADWAKPTDLRRDFASVSILHGGRAVFNLGGNKYRLVVWINYPHRVVYIRFLGTHAQYDKIDARTI